MFDEPASLPMRAAIASLLGSLFGIGLILVTNNANAQTAGPATESPAAVAAVESGLKRLGEAALQTLRGAEPIYGFGNAGARAFRLNASASEPGTGLRWQLTGIPGLRSEGDIPRSHDLVSLGVQVRF
jgi:hypothetical protein